ncbi:fibrillin-2-like [Ptychodera flava]|uniref:fibrillin-2-like n=1 Tax=Ptychodera flava TaxID=63121 RepID=UPI00396A6846
MDNLIQSINGYIDECALENICANGNCENTVGSFFCTCRSGFRVSSDGRTCEDNDECRDNPRICRFGQCLNIPGSYNCNCDSGYQRSPDGKYCLDTIECESTGMCKNGRCIPFNGEFRCECNDGFTLTSKGCEDVNECLEEADICDNGFCQNNPGSFTCRCYPGFELAPNGRYCKEARKGTCFSVTEEGCVDPSLMMVTKSSCCCSMVSMDKPMGWGSPCSRCPSEQSVEFNQLCRFGNGKDADGKEIPCTSYATGFNSRRFQIPSTKVVKSYNLHPY